MRDLVSFLIFSFSLSVSASDTSSSLLCVSSIDTSLTVCVDSISGLITTVSPLASIPWNVNASTILGDKAEIIGMPIVTESNGIVTIINKWCFNNNSLAPLGSCAIVTDVLSPQTSSVHWRVSILGTVSAPWSVPIQTSWIFNDPPSSSLKAWAPWDRGSVNGWSENWVDPLQPSDISPGGWWDGQYRLGNSRDGGDFIIAGLATVLSANPDTLDAGISIHLAPTDIPMDAHLYLQGSIGGLSFSREHYRISSFSPVVLDLEIVGHESDWRSALSFSVSNWPSFWEPHNPEVFSTCAGTGSYSWWLGSLDQTPSYSSMAYKVNWDLSGRFFPYMGMFLPPVAPGVEWLNDPEGTQPRANVSFESIGSWYRQMANNGFQDFSYANVNEYGINVVLPDSHLSQTVTTSDLPIVDEAYISKLFQNVARFLLPPDDYNSSSPQICETTWQNASTCLAEAFPDAVVTHSWDEIGKRVVSGAYVSWQNAIVVDPGVECYHAFMLEQLARHIVYEDAFVGYIIDRSDWMDVSSLQRDDGVTFIPEAVNKTGSGIGASLKVSYQRMVADLRAVLDAGPSALTSLKKQLASASPNVNQTRGIGEMNGTGLMMMNVYGNARLDQFAPYDGIFSEGALVSGAGLLGIMSPTILWTYDSSECCKTSDWSDFYLQRHVLMNVMPMLPFPGNDHAIPFDVTSAELYVRYADLLSAVAPSIWALYPHIISIVNSTETTYAKMNAFVAPLDVEAVDVALLIPVMLGEQGNGTVRLNLTRIDRVWGGAAKNSNGYMRAGGVHIQHPLVKKRLSQREGGDGRGGGGGGDVSSVDGVKSTADRREGKDDGVSSVDGVKSAADHKGKDDGVSSVDGVKSAAASPTELGETSHVNDKIASYSYVFEALWPGQGAQWKQICDPIVNTDSMIVDVGLIDGASLVRARRVPSRE